MDIIQKFQELLKGLFQFETSDLDFGIYRILNYKRDQVERFIEKDLVDKVESAFAKHKDERLANITQRFEEAKQKVIQTLNPDVFTPTGDLREEFKNTQVGREYLSLKAQKDEAQTLDEIKLQVFNDLYSFFSRFYEEGDFVPQYRYSIKGHKYAIPYDGEEVKLYWANNEQYYIKTGLLFRDYTFRAGDYKIVFRIVSAREELGSKKATKQRFFVLDDENAIEIIPSPPAGEGEEEVKDRTLIIRFQYRELTEEEVKSYGVEGGNNTSKQEKINQRSYEEILERVKDVELKTRLGKDYRNGKPFLLYQLSRFAAKNTKDYFIHKNLKRFLSEQLDYFIKAEVLSIDTLEKERFLDKHITRAKVVCEIGEDIIDFLSQIEDFQKRLWEKKKFVLKTEYVITTDRVPKEFYEKIWSNQQQKEEWEELGFNIPKTSQDLKKTKFPIDTKHFTQEFREKLLEKLTEKEDLDDLLDGLLIKSENWQALNLLLEKYGHRVQCVHIDPPYNTQTSGFLYKNNYQHSSWLAMMLDRLNTAWTLVADKGHLLCHVDENEYERLKVLLDSIGIPDAGTVVWDKRNPMTARRGVATQHEYIVWRSAIDESIYQKNTNIVAMLNAAEAIISKHGGVTDDAAHEYAEWVRTNPELTGGEKAYCYLDQEGRIYRPVSLRAPEPRTNPKFFEPLIHPVTNKPCAVPPNGFSRTPETLRAMVERGEILFGPDESTQPQQKRLLTEESQMQVRSVIQDARKGKEYLDALGLNFAYCHPVSLYEELIAASAPSRSAIVLDHFAGSGTTGHAVVNLNRQDGGRRKYILVEIGDWFETVMLPRLKKVVFCEKWKDGKPQGGSGISHMLKYQILEQYEDTLDNIELTPNGQAQLKFGDDYLLKYFLGYETRESPYLLSIDQLKKPFSYKLKVNLEEVGEPQEMVMDIPETFNYLLGLKVKRIKGREIATPADRQARKDKKAASSRGSETSEAISKRKYLFILGEKGGKDIAIVWREYEDKWSEDDFKEDKEFIIKELQPWAPHIVYVNGQSILTPKLGEHTVEIHHIEPEFRRLMG